MSTVTQESPATTLALKADPKAMAFKGLFDNKNFRRSLVEALPKHVKEEHFLRVALSAMSRTPKLYECTPESVLLSLMRAAAMGLEPDGGVLGQGYLVPFFNGATRRMECQFIPGYRGLVKLARNSVEVVDVWAEVVFEKDQFEYELGLNPTMRHRRNDDLEDAGQPKYAYAVARFRDGERKFIVMNRREVEKVRASSASKDKSGNPVGPWKDWPEEMWKKTAVRRLCKMLPLAVEVHQQINSEDEGAITLDPSVMAAVPLDLAALESVPVDVPEPTDEAPPVNQDADDPPLEGIDWATAWSEYVEAVNAATTQPEVNAIYREWSKREGLSQDQLNQLFEASDARKAQIKEGR